MDLPGDFEIVRSDVESPASVGTAPVPELAPEERAALEVQLAAAKEELAYARTFGAKAQARQKIRELTGLLRGGVMERETATWLKKRAQGSKGAFDIDAFQNALRWLPEWAIDIEAEITVPFNEGDLQEVVGYHYKDKGVVHALTHQRPEEGKAENEVKAKSKWQKAQDLGWNPTPVVFEPSSYQDAARLGYGTFEFTFKSKGLTKSVPAIAITAPSGERGVFSTPPTEGIWKWLYEHGLDTDAARSLPEAEAAIPAPRPVDDRIYWTCGACFRAVARVHGRLAAHGYQFPGHSYRTGGNCPGSGRDPWEVSADVTREWTAALVVQAEQAFQRLLALPNLSSFTVMVADLDDKGQRQVDKRGLVVKKPVHVAPGHPWWPEVAKQAWTEAREAWASSWFPAHWFGTIPWFRTALRLWKPATARVGAPTIEADDVRFEDQFQGTEPPEDPPKAWVEGRTEVTMSEQPIWMTPYDDFRPGRQRVSLATDFTEKAADIEIKKAQSRWADDEGHLDQVWEKKQNPQGRYDVWMTYTPGGPEKRRIHREAVLTAFRERQPIPASVLEDYHDLLKGESWLLTSQQMAAVLRGDWEEGDPWPSTHKATPMLDDSITYRFMSWARRGCSEGHIVGTAPDIDFPALCEALDLISFEDVEEIVHEVLERVALQDERTEAAYARPEGTMGEWSMPNGDRLLILPWGATGAKLTFMYADGTSEDVDYFSGQQGGLDAALSVARKRFGVSTPEETKAPEGVHVFAVTSTFPGLDQHDFESYRALLSAFKELGWVETSRSASVNLADPDEVHYFNKLVGGMGRLFRNEGDTYTFLAPEGWLGRVLAKKEKRERLKVADVKAMAAREAKKSARRSIMPLGPDVAKIAVRTAGAVGGPVGVGLGEGAASLVDVFDKATKEQPETKIEAQPETKIEAQPETKIEACYTERLPQGAQGVEPVVVEVEVVPDVGPAPVPESCDVEPPEVTDLTLAWVARAANAKTGPIPTAYVVASDPTADDPNAGSKASCATVACSLLGQGCYAQSGTPRMAMASIVRALVAGADRSLERALAERHPDATAARMTALGDVGATPPLVQMAIHAARRIEKEGLAIIGYTHGWKLAHAAGLRRWFRASCDDLDEADAALEAGWKAAVVLPAETDPRDRSITTPSGAKVKVCPAFVDPAPGRARVTCNRCRLCDAHALPAVIGFPAHGTQERKASVRAGGAPPAPRVRRKRKD